MFGRADIWAVHARLGGKIPTRFVPVYMSTCLLPCLLIEITKGHNYAVPCYWHWLHLVFQDSVIVYSPRLGIVVFQSVQGERRLGPTSREGDIVGSDSRVDWS